MPSLFAELNEQGDRIDVFFRYDQALKDAIKAIPGARFVPRDKGGPLWRLPLDLTSARRLREVGGSGLRLGDALKEWGKEAVKKERNLRGLSTASDLSVEELLVAKKLPALAEWFRPYQRADVKFLATTNGLNLNEPRLGKTTEVIAAIYEAGLEYGPHLVIAPQKTLNSVWRMEIERWTDGDVYTQSGEEKADKDHFQTLFFTRHQRPFWWITTADMIRRGNYPTEITEWNSITIDEYHKTGLAETKNKFPQAVNKIKAKRKYAMSGTPMGGKPIKLWGALHFLEPQQYTSKWRWADQWLEVTKERIWARGKEIVITEVGGIQPGREDEFYAALAPHAVRRTREEELPQLPPKLPIDVWCEMTAKQRRQYDQFAADAEIRIDEHYLSATSILAEYTRLKQFSNAYCEVDLLGETEEGMPKYRVRPTPQSGKLPYLMERLAEVGIDPEDPAGDAQAIVASQFRETVDMVYDYLTEQGIKCAKITGKVSKKEQERVQQLFKAENDSEGYRVCLMVTTLGVGITLDNVESIHVLDETWNPDDQEQLTDRAINTTRLHQVTVFTYRSQDSIEAKIAAVNNQKMFTNKSILDLRRQGFRATVKEAA